ncbi:4612_t:CDS:10 [Diversispora eburnea]|uniref:non-specific serine/threonine protein kinase n=1 Tax=Diversispora eburnea TaxID=1213867 RepID=A0A9N9B142_9GLOM|nr:4612_t:CDS:10 [Diversispora eburnea]
MSSGSSNSINPYPLTNGAKENGYNSTNQNSQTTPPTRAPQPESQTQKTQLSQTPPSVRKKGVKDFEFGKTLGEGSYSTVVSARDRTTGREYAIKILDKKHIIKEKKVKYVNIEKNTLNKMNHPGIVRLYYTFQDPDSLYFVLDHAKNGELLAFIKKLGSFDLNCTQYYTAQILSSIEYMHSQGVIHRDLKPENILLDEKMHVKITDFGTAKIFESNADGEEDARANSFVGTAEYVSPELLKEKAACKSSDFWALGCIIYQLIAGRPPFKGTNEYMTFQKIVNLEYTFPEGFPPVAKDLVQKLLVLNPSERLGSGGNAGIEKLKIHPFFKEIQWDKIWEMPAPRLLPYLPPNPQHNKEELRTNTSAYLRELSDRSEGNNNSPIASGLKQNDPFRLESLVGGEDLSEKVDPEKIKNLEEQKRTYAQWVRFLFKSELIIRVGPINKRKGFFTKKFLLILTDFPRLVYVDQEKMTQKGEIYSNSRMVVELKNKKTFFVHTV